ncbi:hypothetical protein B0J13DRAFT_265785 [Dactylonectria estremocensis]|uniref:Uncharacterized protein n=1 Tax=Dactylonectria estremocensis TaxID=1079267 RepID=A0A9P9J625_9HYPO|nr:hypothetical protein B0J13DRAFT_265785 [Dactylonectria estremocensis]
MKPKGATGVLCILVFCTYAVSRDGGDSQLLILPSFFLLRFVGCYVFSSASPFSHDLDDAAEKWINWMKDRYAGLGGRVPVLVG